jgi:hypothetical protein
MAVISPGIYRINPFLFTMSLADAVDVPDNKIGVGREWQGASGKVKPAQA